MLDNLALAPGDVLTVTRLDRLARSTFDLFGIVKQIVDTKAQKSPSGEQPCNFGVKKAKQARLLPYIKTYARLAGRCRVARSGNDYQIGRSARSGSA